MWVVLNAKHWIVQHCDTADEAYAAIDEWTDRAGCMAPYSVSRLENRKHE